ncbi:hypothetical protein NHN26_16755 [Rhodovulum tesquicola]|uniref:hypothetical protein n=1 Tax=Rhodovulum tesquicola TaxID=540254 RepID=UPI002097BB50|nr:hypothetical protein [Rhodovulum tesquicola]MCO8146856.1 hypothetical protein [Rhodovulum tesquicola]
MTASARAREYFEPDSFCRHVMDTLGYEVVQAIRERLGGQEFKIPHPDNLFDGHPLAEALGLDGARALAEQFNGERVYVPRPTRGATDTALLEAVEAGATNHDLAERYGFTVRHVRRRLAMLGVRNPNHRTPVGRPRSADRNDTAPTRARRIDSNGGLTGSTGATRQSG